MAEEDYSLWRMKAIGYIESCFKKKNGTPRQPVVCEASRAKLTINRDVFSNPDHALDGLQNYSHVWIVFVFHKNNNAYTKAKVRPPRLNGAKVGLFSTRSPYRPNPIGLTLAKLDRVEGATVHLLGVDMLDGTPVLDIKPYIPNYDQPLLQPTDDQHQSSSEITPGGATAQDYNSNDDNSEEDSKQNGKSENSAALESEGFSAIEKPSKGEENEIDICSNSANGEVQSNINLKDASLSEDNVKQTLSETKAETNVAGWISQPPIERLKVTFTSKAESQIEMFSKTPDNPVYALTFLNNPTDAKQAIMDILEADPRSTYRRKKCVDRLYFFILDTMHITVWFDDCDNVAEVVRIMPLTERNKMLVSLDES